MTIKGPFTLTWGDVVLLQVEDLDLQHSRTTEDHVNVRGKTFEIEKSRKITAILTLLATDIASLAAVLPQYAVPQGDTLSTGQSVTNSEGAVEIIPDACDQEYTYHDLEVASCGDPGEVYRLVNARTVYLGTEITNKIRKVKIAFLGEAPARQASIQFVKQGGIELDTLLLDNGDDLILDNGDQMLLD